MVRRTEANAADELSFSPSAVAGVLVGSSSTASANLLPAKPVRGFTGVLGAAAIADASLV
jgi:hypothetical protein